MNRRRFRHSPAQSHDEQDELDATKTTTPALLAYGFCQTSPPVAESLRAGAWSFQ